MNIFGLELGKKKDRYMVEFDKEPAESNQDGLINFKDLEKMEGTRFHDAYKFGEHWMFGRMGSVWKLYNKYGMPFTEGYHSIKLVWSGQIECTVGARVDEYSLDDIYEMNNGLQKMISAMIEEKA